MSNDMKITGVIVGLIDFALAAAGGPLLYASEKEKIEFTKKMFQIDEELINKAMLITISTFVTLALVSALMLLGIIFNIPWFFWPHKLCWFFFGIVATAAYLVYQHFLNKKFRMKSLAVAILMMEIMSVSVFVPCGVCKQIIERKKKAKAAARAAAAKPQTTRQGYNYTATQVENPT